MLTILVLNFLPMNLQARVPFVEDELPTSTLDASSPTVGKLSLAKIARACSIAVARD